MRGSSQTTVPNVGILLLLLLSTGSGRGYSFFGPFQAGMNTNYFRWEGHIGGPVAATNSYRWNVPFVTYGFAPDFIEHYGAQGVAAVEEAVAIINALPLASDVNPGDYPVESLRENLLASELSLNDMKSYALTRLVNALGLAPPVEFMWVVDRSNGVLLAEAEPPPGLGTNYPVSMRNYNWLNGEPSSVVADYYFHFRFLRRVVPGLEPFIEAIEFQVDTTAIRPVTVAEGTAVGSSVLSSGQFFTDLTRDDVAGLRYLLHPTNRHVETLLPDVVAWPPGNPAELVRIAERPGVDKITLVRLDPGQSLTLRFEDSYFNRGHLRRQRVGRVLTGPDILFTATDLGLRRGDLPVGGSGSAVSVLHAFAPNIAQVLAPAIWENCSGLNGRPGAEGPGIIKPGMTIALGTPARYRALDHSLESSTLNRPYYYVRTYTWGSFDATTNPPITLGATTNTLPAQLMFESGQTNGETSFTWAWLGRLNSIYHFESSTNLINWTTATLMTNTNGIFFLSKTNADPQRFYRLSEIAQPR